MATKIVAIKKQKLKAVEQEEEFVLSNEWVLPSRLSARGCYKQNTILKYRVGQRKSGTKGAGQMDQAAGHDAVNQNDQ